MTILKAASTARQPPGSATGNTCRATQTSSCGPPRAPGSAAANLPCDAKGTSKLSSATVNAVRQYASPQHGAEASLSASVEG